MLKVLEGETDKTIGQQIQLFHERALPNLSDNIKCGNSLVGPDYFAGNLIVDADEIKRLNPFDWTQEFPDATKAGGFDCIIGNPPYVRQETLGDLKGYLQSHYKVFHGVADLYTYFIEKGIGLLKSNGHFCYIVANKWMRANYGKPLRSWLKQQHIVELIDFGDLPVFHGATTYPCILNLIKKKANSNFAAAKVDTLQFINLNIYLESRRYSVDQIRLGDSGWSLASDKEQNLIDKCNSLGIPLNKYVNGNIYRGVLTGLNEAFVISKEKREELIIADRKSEELINPFLAGKEIKRYEWLQANNYILLIPKGFTIQKSNSTNHPWKWFKDTYPAIANHLEPFKEKAEKRWDKGDYWWELRACDYYKEFEKTKIVYAEIATRGQFTLDSNQLFSDTTSYIMSSDSLYLLGIFNSSLWEFLFRNVSSEIRGGFLRWKNQYMKHLPIAPVKTNGHKLKHDNLTVLVQFILDLHKTLVSTLDPHARKLLLHQIDATDAEIDNLVYDLYGLTQDEIAIVEGSNP